MTTEIIEFVGFCPIHDGESAITKTNLVRAVGNASRTFGKVIVTCPKCCGGLVLSDTVPKNLEALEPWLRTATDDDIWGGCVPALEIDVFLIPAGFKEERGVKMYRPGTGEKFETRVDYLIKYGIDPECYLMGHGRIK